MSYKIALILLIASLFTSCISQKEFTYFQPVDEKNDIEKMDIKEKYIPKLQSGDILTIMVMSLSPEANVMFNVFPDKQIMQSSTPAPAVGFLIDEGGDITLPLTGKLKVNGLTTKEASDLITKSLDKYLVQPTVSVRILNYKISVLGEVAKPSSYNILNERVTITEAISLAGDLTIFGKRQNILIIRESEGKREFGRVDLTQRDFFNSPYYYLRPNDIVYVEPVKGKTTSTSRTVQLAPLFISMLSFLIAISSSLIR